MSNRLEALQFLLRDAEGVATLAAVINGRAELQQTLVMMCPAFAPRPVVAPMMNQFSIPAPSFQQVSMPLNSPGGYMPPFNIQGPPLTPNSTSQFAAPMPVCPKCHHSYGPERMAVHVKVCGGNLDMRSDGLRSPIGFGRTLSSSGLEQLSREPSINLDEHPTRLLIAEAPGRLTIGKDDSIGRGSFEQPTGGAFMAKEEQPIGGGSRRNSLTEIRSPYAAKDDKPVGRAGGAYAAKDDQPIGGGSRRNSLTEIPRSPYAAKDDKPVGRAGGAYAAKDDQPIGGGSRRNSLTEIPRSPYAAKDDKPVGRGAGAYAAKDDQPIGGARAANAYTAKDDQPIGGARKGFEEPTGGAFVAKEERPVGGGRGTGAFAAKEEQPIGGGRRRSVKEESLPAFTDEQDRNRAGTGAYLAKDEQPIGGGRRRSVKEERSSFPEQLDRGGGAYLAKDEKPVGGGSRGASGSMSKDDQPGSESIGGGRRRSVKEEQPPSISEGGGGAYLAKDEKPVGGGSGRPGTGAYAAKDEQPIGGRPGTGAYAAKDEQPIGSSRGRSVTRGSGTNLSQELKEGGSRRGSLVEDTEAINEEDGEVAFEDEDEDQWMLKPGTDAFLAKDEKPVGRARLEDHEEAPDQEEARVACPKCSRQFASSRIDKHTKVCKADPNAVPEEKPEPKLTPKPPPKKLVETPSSPTGESGAKKKSFAERQMEAIEAKFQACPKCARKFAPDRIVKHESVCKGMGVKRPEEDAEEPVKEEVVEVAPPPRERAVSPKKSAPAPPPEGGKRKTFAERQMEAMEAKFQACGKCGRKFAPDRVDKHENVCKGKQPPLMRSSAGSAEEVDNETSPPPPKPTAGSKLDPTASCGFCKRKYPKDQLEAHESVCQVLLLEDEVVLTATQASRTTESAGSKKVQLPAGFKPMQR